MNKAQLIDAIAEKAGLTKADSKKALEAFVETVGEALKGGVKVALIGFGSFSVSERSARSGRNHRLAKRLLFRLRKVVKFKAGAELAENSDQEIKIKEGVFRKSTPSFVWVVYGKTENRELEGTPFGVYRQRTLVYSPPG